MKEVKNYTKKKKIWNF